MTTQLAPTRMDLPPPLASVRSDAGSVVGWVSDDAIGFRGFADETEAMAAAWMAYRTLARTLARRDGTRLVPIDLEPLALARDGQREVILASGRSIATLIRPGDDSPSGPHTFGFEIDVPPPRDAALMRRVAFLLYRTLRRSGIRWAMWRADERGGARLHARDASHASHASRVATDDVRERPGRAGGRASEGGSRDAFTGASMVRRRVAGVTAALAVLAVAILLPLLTTSLVTTVLGAIAALAAAAALAGIVRLVATDIGRDVRQALERLAPRRRETRPPARPDPVNARVVDPVRLLDIPRRVPGAADADALQDGVRSAARPLPRARGIAGQRRPESHRVAGT